MGGYFPRPNHAGGEVKVKLYWSNYVIKRDLKSATSVDTSKIPKKIDLANLNSESDKLDVDELEKVPLVLTSLKSKVEKLDVDKLLAVPVDLSKLSDVVKNDVVKKTEYGELVKKVNATQNTDISNLVKKNSLCHKN